LSQTDLADELGLSFQQVQKYEKGTNRMGASRLRHRHPLMRARCSASLTGCPADRKRKPSEIVMLTLRRCILLRADEVIE
jgi:hypothetical protein